MANPVRYVVRKRVAVSLILIAVIVVPVTLPVVINSQGPVIP